MQTCIISCSTQELFPQCTSIATFLGFHKAIYIYTVYKYGYSSKYCRDFFMCYVCVYRYNKAPSHKKGRKRNSCNKKELLLSHILTQ